MNWAIRGDKEPDKNKQLHILSVKEYEELSEKLTKYKKAFEVLKDKLNFELVYDEEYCGDDIWYLDCRSGTEITKEEYELLEELMKGEEIR